MNKNSTTYLICSVLIAALMVSGWGCNKSFSRHKQAVKHYVTAVALQNGELDSDAIIELQEAVKQDPDFSIAHSLLGDILKQEGKLGDAATSYSKACLLDPWSFPDHYKLGGVCKLLKRFKEAIKAYNTACKLKPEHADSNFSLGACYFAVGEVDKAEKYCTKANELQPGDSTILSTLGNIHGKKGNDLKAIAFYKQTLEINTKQPEIMRRLGMVYVRQKRYAPAKLILTKAAEMAPDSSISFVALAYCMLCDNDAQGALETYKKAVLLNKTDFEALNGVGASSMTIYFENQTKTEFLDMAIKYWTESLKVNPEQPGISNLLKKYSPLASKSKNAQT